MTGPGQFRVKSSVPKVLSLPNIKAEIDLSINVFEGGIVTKNECLEPVKSAYIIPSSIIMESSESRAQSEEPVTPPATTPTSPSTPSTPITAETPATVIPAVEETPRMRENESFGDMLERLLQTMFN